VVVVVVVVVVVMRGCWPCWCLSRRRCRALRWWWWGAACSAAAAGEGWFPCSWSNAAALERQEHAADIHTEPSERQWAVL